MGALRVAGVPGLRPLIILGVTGSIGRQALEVAANLDIPVAGLAARRGSEELLVAAARHPDAKVAVAGPTPSERETVQQSLGDRAIFGPGALTELAAMSGTTVVNGVVGSAGLPSSVAALDAGNRLALANKESLVAGGPVVMAARQRGGGTLIPVDSEHSALAQCLVGEDPATIRRLIVSASGGPFRGRSQGDLEHVTVAEALDHPTWSMGPRITIDSATLMNKAFEVIEAHLLFDVPYDQIDVVVHPQSIVHSAVEFVDGSVKAQMGDPDMRGPIQWAVTGTERMAGTIGSFDFTAQSLTFEAPDLEAFPCLRLGYEAGRAGGSAPAVLNAADEIAVQAFLEGRIGFTSIAEVVERTLADVSHGDLLTVDDVFDVDRRARAVAAGHTGGVC